MELQAPGNVTEPECLVGAVLGVGQVHRLRGERGDRIAVVLDRVERRGHLSEQPVGGGGVGQVDPGRSAFDDAVVGAYLTTAYMGEQLPTEADAQHRNAL